MQKSKTNPSKTEFLLLYLHCDSGPLIRSMSWTVLFHQFCISLATDLSRPPIPYKNATGDSFRNLSEDSWYLQFLIFPEALKVFSTLIQQYLSLDNPTDYYSSLFYILHISNMFVWLWSDRISWLSAVTIWIDEIRSVALAVFTKRSGMEALKTLSGSGVVFCTLKCVNPVKTRLSQVSPCDTHL